MVCGRERVIWSQNHIYLYINSGIKINGGHTVDIKLNCSVLPNCNCMDGLYILMCLYIDYIDIYIYRLLPS